MSWYPEQSDITIAELDDQATFTMEGGNLEQFELHIFDLSDWLDAEGIPANAPIRECWAHTKTNGPAGTLKKDVQAAVRYRKSAQYSLRKTGRDKARDTPPDKTAGQTAGHSGTEPETHTNKGGTESGTLRDTIEQAQRDTLSPRRGDRVHGPQTEHPNQPTYEEF
jgi:hypothetical protein